MQYREMPKIGDKISILGFGCMRLAGGQLRPDEKLAIEQIRSAIDRGVNYVDTAWPYHGGKSEVILGKALKDGYREKVKLADKLPHWICKTVQEMDEILDEQLKRLDVDVIDYYLIHGIDHQTWTIAKENGVIEFIKRAKESGKIVNTGFSFHGPRDGFMQIIDDYDWDFCQIQFNILDEHDQAGIEGLEYAASRDIGVIIMEPLRGGSLSGKLPDEVEKVYNSASKKRSNAEWALRWIWNHPGVITVLSGMNDEEHIKENIRIASEAEAGSLTEEELAVIQKAGDTFRKLMKVSCTGCQYCMPCPQGVNIPTSFTIYNNKYLFGKGIFNKIFYLSQCGGLQGKEPAFASQCTNCGTCLEKCPQKIDIPSNLENVEKDFEGILTKPLLFLLDKAMSRKKKKKSDTG